jgi:hypothetical protein
MNTQEGLFILTGLILIVAVITLVVLIVHGRKPKPIIIVDEEEGVLKYKNIGNDSAVEIQTEEVSLNLFSIFFSTVNLLQPNEKLKLEAKVTGKNLSLTLKGLECIGIHLLHIIRAQRGKSICRLCWSDARLKKWNTN